MQSRTARNEISLLGAQQSDSIWGLLPSHHHTLFFLVSSPIWILPAYQKAATFKQQEQPKKITSAQNRVFQGESKESTPVCRQPHKWDELQVCCGSGALDLCGMISIPLINIKYCWLLQVLWTATKHQHNGKGSTANGNKACSQPGLGSQPLFYSGSFKTC